MVPATIDIVPVQLPGREARINEASFTSVPALVDTLTQEVRRLLDMPYALFGHSYGAVLAFELARALRRSGDALPVMMCPAASPAPQLPRQRPPLHTISNEGFVKAVMERYRGIPSEVLDDPELLALVAGPLRADLRAVETYTYSPEEPLACPIVAFGGTEDPVITQEDVAAWRHQTSGLFEIRMFPGDHFFVQREQGSVTSQLSDLLRRWM